MTLTEHPRTAAFMESMERLDHLSSLEPLALAALAARSDHHTPELYLALADAITRMHEELTELEAELETRRMR